MLLALERLFAADYDDGTLEQMLLAPQPLFILVLGQSGGTLVGNWPAAGADGATVGLQYDLSRCPQDTALFSVAGTPALSLIGAIGAALYHWFAWRGVLVSLLVLLPASDSYFGAGAVEANVSGLGSRAIFMLGALLVLCCCLHLWQPLLHCGFGGVEAFASISLYNGMMIL